MNKEPSNKEINTITWSVCFPHPNPTHYWQQPRGAEVACSRLPEVDRRWLSPGGTSKSAWLVTVHGNKALKEIVGSNNVVVSGKFCTLHYKEIHSSSRSPCIVIAVKSRSLQLSEVLWGKPLGRQPLWRLRTTQKDNINMALWEMGWVDERGM
jgi:hypothetical protein